MGVCAVLCFIVVSIRCWCQRDVARRHFVTFCLRRAHAHTRKQTNTHSHFLLFAVVCLQLDELYKLLYQNYVEDDDNMFRFNYSKEFLKWCAVLRCVLASVRAGLQLRHCPYPHMHTHAQTHAHTHPSLSHLPFTHTHFFSHYQGIDAARVEAEVAPWHPQRGQGQLVGIYLRHPSRYLVQRQVLWLHLTPLLLLPLLLLGFEGRCIPSWFFSFFFSP